MIHVIKCPFCCDKISQSKAHCRAQWFLTLRASGTLFWTTRARVLNSAGTFPNTCFLLKVGIAGVLFYYFT